MAVSRSVSVGTTAVDVTAETITGSSYVRMLIYNNGSALVYIGGAGVTTATGIPIPPGGSLAVGARDEVFAVVASGTHELRVLEGV